MGGTFLVVLGLSLVSLGEVMCWKDLISLLLTHLSLGEHSLGETFHNWVAIALSIHPVLGGSSLGNTFPLGYITTPRGNPLWGMYGHGSIHALESDSILRGHYPSGTSHPSRSTNIGGPQGSFGTSGDLSSSQYSSSHTPFHFFSMLEFPYFSHLKNDPISHDPSWSVMSTKLPSNMLKFERNSREELSTHIMTYNLWCSSKSLMDDSIRLHILQISLTKRTTKWYIELKGDSFNNFNDLEMVFLTHYQFPIWYEIIIELLTSLCQDTATQIYDHVHEWR
jgi:hypothetical protein